jgi:hypothetical protein
MRRWQSGQLHVAVDHAPFGLRGFESLPAHKLRSSKANTWSFVAIMIWQSGVIRSPIELFSSAKRVEKSKLGFGC